MGELASIRIFGAADRIGKRDDGEIASAEPGWMNPRALEDLEREIKNLNGLKDMAFDDPNKRMSIMEECQKKEHRLEQIRASKPNLSDKQKDTLNKVVNGLAKAIKDLNVPYDSDQRGVFDVQRLVRFNENAVIPLDGNEDLYDWAKVCGAKTRQGNDGKVGLDKNVATRLWQLGRKTLGESSHTSQLVRITEGGAKTVIGPNGY